MPFINLIAEQRMMARRAERRTRVAFMGFVGSASIVAATFGVLLYMTEATSGDVGRLEAEVKKLQPIRDEIAASQKSLAELWPRLTTLEDAQMMTARWSRILGHLSHHTPGTMWLTAMRAAGSDPTKPIQATFQGITGRLEPVGEFILRLQLCEDLQSVNLKYAQEKIVSDGRGIEFEVTADVAGTAETQTFKKQEKSSA
jgi:Tfp pilus assembly protein PilN